MMLDELTVLRVAAALAAGFVLGGLYFGGLWWTSRRLPLTRVPGLLFAASFIVRMAVLLGGIYFVTRGRLIETSLCVVGILIARRVAIHLVRPAYSDGVEAEAGP